MDDGAGVLCLLRRLCAAHNAPARLPQMFSRLLRPPPPSLCSERAVELSVAQFCIAERAPSLPALARALSAAPAGAPVLRLLLALSQHSAPRRLPWHAGVAAEQRLGCRYATGDVAALLSCAPLADFAGAAPPPALQLEDLDGAPDRRGSSSSSSRPCSLFGAVTHRRMPDGVAAVNVTLSLPPLRDGLLRPSLVRPLLPLSLPLPLPPLAAASAPKERAQTPKCPAADARTPCPSTADDAADVWASADVWAPRRAAERKSDCDCWTCAGAAPELSGGALSAEGFARAAAYAMRGLQAPPLFEDDSDGCLAVFPLDLPHGAPRAARAAADVGSVLRIVEGAARAYSRETEGSVSRAFACALRAELSTYHASLCASRILARGPGAGPVESRLGGACGRKGVSTLDVLVVAMEARVFLEPLTLAVGSQLLRGAALLNHLHGCLEVSGPTPAPSLVRLFRAAVGAYMRIGSRWMTQGELDDQYGEFMIARDPTACASPGESWQREFVVRGKEFVPRMLERHAKAVLDCGRSMRLLSALGFREQPEMPAELPDVSPALTHAELARAAQLALGLKQRWQAARSTTRDAQRPARPSADGRGSPQAQETPRKPAVSAFDDWETLVALTSADLDGEMRAAKKSLTESLEEYSRKPTVQAPLQVARACPACPLPLDSALDASIGAFVVTQNAESCAAALSLIEKSLELHEHFKALRLFLLLGAGDFAESLCERLYRAMEQGTTLQNCLSGALIASGRDRDKFVSRLSLAVVASASHNGQATLAPSSLDAVRLVYSVPEWALRTVLTDESMSRYDTIWRFSMKLRRASSAVSRVWQRLREAPWTQPSARGHMLSLFAHEMGHFVRAIQNYMATEAIEVPWREFERQLPDAASVDSVRAMHDSTLRRIEKRCLLNTRAATVARVVDSALALVTRFQGQVEGIAQGGSSDAAELLVHKTRASFLDLSRTLFDVLSRLCYDRGYQPHLHHLLTALNYNSFYTNGTEGHANVAASEAITREAYLNEDDDIRLYIACSAVVLCLWLQPGHSSCNEDGNWDMTIAHIANYPNMVYSIIEVLCSVTCVASVASTDTFCSHKVLLFAVSEFSFFGMPLEAGSYISLEDSRGSVLRN
eukprot:m51a1_g3999 hypothetical protein (1118) ;mRNA; r:516902-521689